MSNGKMIVTRETWKELDEEDRGWLLYETVNGLEKRVERIEGRNLFDKTCSFLGGVLGGVAAVLGWKVVGH